MKLHILVLVFQYRAYERGSSVGTSIPGPESQEGARESLKDPITNVKLGKAVLIKIDILILRKSINVT
jgi:hypothetical protein